MSEPQHCVPQDAAWSRQRVLAMGIGAVVVLSLAAVFGVRAVVAHRQLEAAREAYTSAMEDLRGAVGDAQDADQELTGAVDAAEAAVSTADAALAAAEDGIVGPEEKVVLATVSGDAAALIDEAAALKGVVEPAVGKQLPETTEALHAGATSLAASASELEAGAQDDREWAGRLDAATAGVAEAGEAFVGSLTGMLDGLMSANDLADVDSRTAVTEAVSALPVDGVWDQADSDAVAAYVDSVHALQESQATEQTRRDQTVEQQQARVEAFAQSIAPGVDITFEWGTIVNDRGSSTGSFGGTATWDTWNGTHTSTITLSENIAAEWSSVSARAVVVHEVGHAMTSKCFDLYSSAFGSEGEVWATAWAIGMGYDVDGSGESLYGRPSDDLIASSMQCR